MTDAADFYTGVVADAYATLRAETFDPERYASFVREHGEPALEVGCGAGEPLLQLVAEGLVVDGVDSSPDMVDLARTAARERGLDVALHVARMEDMDLGRRYASIYLAGPTFELLPDDHAALRALRAFRRHLAPGGTVMIPLWIAGPTPAEQLGATREAVDEDGTVLRYTPLSEEHDVGTRTRRTAVRYERVPREGPTECVDREWVIHWQTRHSIAELAARAGLVVRDDERTGATTSAAPDDEPGAEFTVLASPAS